MSEQQAAHVLSVALRRKTPVQRTGIFTGFVNWLQMESYRAPWIEELVRVAADEMRADTTHRMNIRRGLLLVLESSPEDLAAWLGEGDDLVEIPDPEKPAPERPARTAHERLMEPDTDD